MKSERESMRFAALALATIVIAGTSTPMARSNDSQEKKARDAAAQSANVAKAFEAIMQVPDAV